MNYERQRYTRYMWTHFRKNKPALAALYVFISLVIVSMLSDLIANRQPLYARYRGRNFFPAFETFFHKTRTDSSLNPSTGKYEKLQYDITDWRELPLDHVIWTPIPYSASESDRFAMDYVAPGAAQQYNNAKGNMVPSPYVLKHHLGTNRIGQDVTSGLIHGTRIALKVGLLSMVIAAILGIILGGISGFFGDYRIKISRGALIMTIPGLFFGIFYGFMVRSDALKNAFDTDIIIGIFQFFLSLVITIAFVSAFVYLRRLLKKMTFFSGKIFVPIDIIILKLIEIFDSIPALLFIITFSALFVNKSLALVIIIIGILFAPQIARLTRTEFIRIRMLDYIQSARALGIGNMRIIFRHILPNAIAPVFVALAFGAASAIIAESSLSFLGIGVPADIVTWGSLLSYSRDNFNAWWMVVFPGLAIFISVTMFNLIGEGLGDALNPRGKF